MHKKVKQKDQQNKMLLELKKWKMKMKTLFKIVSRIEKNKLLDKMMVNYLKIANMKSKIT